MKVSKIGIFSQVLFQETIDIIHDLLSVNGATSISFFLNPDLYEFLSKTGSNFLDRCQKVPLRKMVVDCIIPIGGDGTILRVARTRPKIPILSINKGRKGVMTEIEPKNVKANFEDFLNGKFMLEEHHRLEAFIGEKSIGSAINEVVITSVDLLKAIDFRVLIDDVITSGSLADGIIIATAIGSTGHSLSSGGCIIDPILDNFEISWINPINLAIRPLILASSRDIKIRCATRINPLKIVIDGQISLEYNPPIEILLLSSKETVKFYRSHPFMNRLRQKIPEIQE
ncbi:MAG: NAD(+)/NADH kinase [Candidatus Hodarchaeales archaeon]|jgi:NAD+ kinase